MPKFIKFLFVLGLIIGAALPVVGFAWDEGWSGYSDSAPADNGYTYYGDPVPEPTPSPEPAPSPGYQTAGDGQTYDDFGNVVQQQNPSGACYYNPATGMDSCSGGGAGADPNVDSGLKPSDPALRYDAFGNELKPGELDFSTNDTKWMNDCVGQSAQGCAAIASQNGVSIGLDTAAQTVESANENYMKAILPEKQEGALYDTLQKGDGYEVVQNRFGVFYVGASDMTPAQQAAANADVDAMRDRLHSAEVLREQWSANLNSAPVVVGGAAPSFSGGDSGGSSSDSGSSVFSSSGSSSGSSAHTPSYSSHSQAVNAAASDVSEEGAPVATSYRVENHAAGIVASERSSIAELSNQNLRSASEFGSSRVDPEKAFSSDGDSGKYLKKDASADLNFTRGEATAGGMSGSNGSYDPDPALTKMFGQSKSIDPAGDRIVHNTETGVTELVKGDAAANIEASEQASAPKAALNDRSVGLEASLQKIEAEKIAKENAGDREDYKKMVDSSGLYKQRDDSSSSLRARPSLEVGDGGKVLGTSPATRTEAQIEAAEKAKAEIFNKEGRDERDALRETAQAKENAEFSRQNPNVVTRQPTPNDAEKIVTNDKEAKPSVEKLVSRSKGIEDYLKNPRPQTTSNEPQISKAEIEYNKAEKEYKAAEEAEDKKDPEMCEKLKAIGLKDPSCDADTIKTESQKSTASPQIDTKTAMNECNGYAKDGEYADALRCYNRYGLKPPAVGRK